MIIEQVQAVIENYLVWPKRVPFRLLWPRSWWPSEHSVEAAPVLSDARRGPSEGGESPPDIPDEGKDKEKGKGREKEKELRPAPSPRCSPVVLSDTDERHSPPPSSLDIADLKELPAAKVVVEAPNPNKVPFYFCLLTSALFFS